MADPDGIRRWVTIVVLSILVLIILFPFALAGYWKYRLRAEIADIKARGEPVTPADLAGPRIPDSKNAAIAYGKIFEQLDSPQESKDRIVLDDFASEWKRAETPALWGQANDILVRNQWVFPLLREAASEKKCRFPVDWGADPLHIKYPHLMKIRYLSQLLHARAVLSTKAGEMDKAVESVRLGYALSESLKDEPALIPQLVRVKTLDTASQSLSESLSYGAISDLQAKDLSDLLTSIDLSDSVRKALTGERVIFLRVFDKLRQDPGALDPSMSRKGPPVRLPYLHVLWTYADEFYYLRGIGRSISRAEMPYREEMAGRLTSYREPPGYALVSSMSLLYPKASWDKAMAAISGSQILLALHTYRNSHGSYPETLEALKIELPEDRYSGKPFIYKRKGAGFLMYSVGWNQKDDGGISFKEKDIVWEMDH